MAAALRLSRRHEGLTAENPAVGCLLVRDGTIVGRGATAPGGRPHAERVALDQAGEAAHGATAYVTLEPCAHHGRTPPCADALIEAGVARVVIGASDPDPRVAGRGRERLRSAGIPVTSGVLAAEARAQMAPFLSRIERGRPHVLLKLAVSPDGFIGRSSEGNVAVTGPVARAQVHLMRARADAVVVGSGTALLDRPALDVRLPGLAERSPPAVVLDRSGRCGPMNPRYLVLAGIDAMLERARADGWGLVMVEGGAALARSLLSRDLVDEVALFVGARPLGGDVASPLDPDHVPRGFTLVREDHFGPDRLRTFRRS